MFKPGDRVAVIYDKSITSSEWMKIYPEGSVVTLTEIYRVSVWKTNKYDTLSMALLSEKNMIPEEIYSSPLYKAMEENET